MAYHAPPDLRSRLTRALLFSASLLLGALLGSSAAQITLDGSLGPPGPLTGPDYRIGVELGQLRGSNLFHSFGAFNVPTGGSATFTGPPTIANILSRVTGGQPSAIDGVLRSEIAGANLFLLNPSGVLFGPNASLDVSGSFHVSTADFLRFADGATFSAHLGQASVLTVAEPAAFGFLGRNPAPITIRESVLEVPTGQALSVIGGDIEIRGGPLGFLAAPGGRIQLASVASPGEVIFGPLELAPDLQLDGFARLGRIQLSELALLDVSGNGGGMVLLRAGRLWVDHSTIAADNTGPVDGSGVGLDLRVVGDAVVANGSFLTTHSSRAGRARDLRVTAGSVHMDNSFIGSQPSASGNGGAVTLNIGTLTLIGGAQITSTTRGSGGGGEVSVVATDTIAIAGHAQEGRPSGLFSDALSTGDAGQLFVFTPRLTLTGGAEISSTTRGSGRGGEVSVVATEAITLAGQDREGNRSGLFTNTFASGNGGRLRVFAPTLTLEGGAIQAAVGRESRGNAGDIEVRGERLTLTGGAQIATSTLGQGRGGAVSVVATEALSITGSDSGLFSNVFSTGDAGRLFVFAPTLSMENGLIQAVAARDSRGNAGDIEVRGERLTLTGGAQISASTRGSGRGGQVTVTAVDTIAISGQDSQGSPSGLFSSTSGSGEGGDLQVAASHILLRDGGEIAAGSFGDGPAGTIRIQVSDTFRSQNSGMTTASTRAGGGRIELHAGHLVQLMDSTLTTTVRGGGGDAGNLTLDAPFIVADRSQVMANAFGGRGGNVQISSDVFLRDPASRVSASSELGIQGMVEIRAPVTSLGGTLAPLPQAFVNVAALLPARCAARLSGGQTSSLVLGGRDGLPADPSGVLPSPLVLDERRAADPALTGAPHQQPPAARFALLADHEKGLPRLGCPP
jgi:filamentous hemagglutinin family protein